MTITGRRAAPPSSWHRAVLVVTCIALATVVAAVASLNVALPSIARDSHASQTQLSWIIDAYSLTFAALLLLAGALGDRYGRRRALLAGLTVYGAGSVAATTSADAGWLIGTRAVLGLGAALVMPATLSTITSTFPAAQRAKAVGTWAGVAGGSAILGILASGLLLEQWSWRAVFFINVALSVTAIAGTLRFVPESAQPDAPPIDRPGAVLAVAGLTPLVYSIIEAPDVGWTTSRTLFGIAAGLLVLACFIAWELRATDPLLDPRLFRLRPFAAGTLTITVQFFAFFGVNVLLLQYLQLVLGYRPLGAALSLLPLALSMMPTARLVAPRLADRLGRGTTSAAGLAIAAAALAGLSTLRADSSGWLLLAVLVPLGAGMALAMTPATATVTDALPRDKQGVGSAVNDLSRELGGALGIAVLGSVQQSVYRSRLHVSGLPASLATEARSSLALTQRLGGPVARDAERAFVAGMHYALLAGAGALLAAAIGVLALNHPRRAALRSGGPDLSSDDGRLPTADGR